MPYRLSLVVMALVVLLLTAPGCVSWPYGRDIPLTSRISVHESRTCEYSAIAGIAHNGELPLILPIPAKSDYARKKTVLRDGVTVGTYGRYAEFHPSPDERFLVVEPGLHNNPMLVVDMDRQSSVTVKAPRDDPEGHYYTYPFSFVSWAPDSSSILVEVRGSTFSKSDGPSGEYRELWQVDPQLGRAIRTDRQEGLPQDLSRLPPGFLDDAQRRAAQWPGMTEPETKR